MPGLAITTQVSSLAGRTSGLIGRILVWVVVRELGPLFAAIIVIARLTTRLLALLFFFQRSAILGAADEPGIAEAVERIRGLERSR